MSAIFLLSILKQRHLSLGAVESMTGGAFSKAITDVPGASEVFLGSLVTYTVKEKVALLGLDQKIVDSRGVVSKEVAEQMATFGREKLDVDVCISITGNAGPTCEPGGQPVGMAFVSIATKGKLYNTHLSLSGERTEIREQAVASMIECLIALLK